MLGRDPVSAHIHDNDKWDISVIKSIHPEMHSLLVFKCGDAGYYGEESNV